MYDSNLQPQPTPIHGPSREGHLGGPQNPYNSNENQQFLIGEKPLVFSAGSPQENPKKITNSVARITGLDIARALCILGMVLAHFVADDGSTDWFSLVLGTVNGRASLAFVFVAGFGVALLDGSRGAKSSAKTLLWRAFLLVLMGVLLQEVSPGPVIILQFYAFFYLVGWIGARLPSWALAILIVFWFVLGVYGWWFQAPILQIGHLADSPLRHLIIILYTGQYPVITWGPVVLLGVLVSRLDWHDRRVVWAMLVASALVLTAVHVGLSVVTSRLADAGGVLPEWLILEPHSNSVTYLLDGYASAVLLVCLCVLAAPYLGPLSRWLAIGGRQALTLYICHMVWCYLHLMYSHLIFFGLITTFPAIQTSELLVAILNIAINYAGAFICFAALLVQANLWQHFFGLGPFERLLRLPKPAGA